MLANAATVRSVSELRLSRNRVSSVNFARFASSSSSRPASCRFSSTICARGRLERRDVLGREPRAGRIDAHDEVRIRLRHVAHEEARLDTGDRSSIRPSTRGRPRRGTAAGRARAHESRRVLQQKRLAVREIAAEVARDRHERERDDAGRHVDASIELARAANRATRRARCRPRASSRRTDARVAE